MNNYVRYEVTVKYTRHPYTLDDKGHKIQVFNKTESASWFDTVYPEGKKTLTEGIAKDMAKKKFLSMQISHIKIDQIRAVKQRYIDSKDIWV